MHSLLLVLLFSLSTAVQAQEFSFINPPTPGEAGDYSQNPTYTVGSNVGLSWQPGSEEISLVLWQSIPDTTFDYVFQNQANINLPYTWVAGTTRNLSVSNVFFFQIFITNQTGPTQNSHYFNLTDARLENSGSSAAASSTTRVTKTSSSPTTTGPSTTNSVASTIAANTTAAATTTSTSTPSGGLSTGAKVGLGVGIPVAVILGVLAGWFLFGRHRNKPNQVLQNQVPAYSLGNVQTEPIMLDNTPSMVKLQPQAQYQPMPIHELHSTPHVR